VKARRNKRAWLSALIVIALAAAAVFGMRQVGRVRAAENLPSAPARKGEFLVIVRCRGEIVAQRSVQLHAPRNVPDLRIVWLATPGGAIHTGDPVIRFDPSSARQQQDEKKAALRQAQATLDQAVAQGRITAELDKRELAAARYQVERAKLEASKQAIVSVLQGEESKIDLASAEEKLRVQEATVNLHQKSDEGKIASFKSQRDKAKAELDLIERRLTQMEIKAPLTGVVTYLSNYSQGWMNAQPFKVGDRAWPGGAIAEIPDMNTLQLEGKVEEVDRGRIAVGQEIRVRADAFPEKTLPGKLVLISPLAEQNWEWPPTRNFRAYAKIDPPDSRLRTGMNGSLDIVVSRIPAAVSIPSKAVFTHAGKPVVYVSDQNAWRRMDVELLARNPDEVAVKGIEGGQMVALTEPETAGDKK
jgi:RND family efflux transporter MFP subunit